MTCMFSPEPLINFIESGSGTPVLLLHGSASNARQWRSLSEYLEGRFQVICADLPGYGRSPAPSSDQGMSLEASARAMAPVIGQAEEPVHLVGHSFGAAVALKIATLWPEKVRSLTLIEPAAFNVLWTAGGPDAPAARAFAAMGRSSRAFMQAGDVRQAMRVFIDFWNGAGAWDRTSADLQGKLAPCIARVLNDFDALVTDVTTDLELAGIVCPVQILRGACSPDVVATISSHLVDRLPFATQIEFAGAGHMLPLTDPHLVDPKIADFLEKVDRTWQSCWKPAALAA